MIKIVVILMLFTFFSIHASAMSAADGYMESMIDEAGLDVEQMLRNLGIESGNFEELLNIEFSNIVEQFLSLCRNEMKEPITVAVTTGALMLLLTMIKNFTDSNATIAPFMTTVGLVMLSFSLLVPVTGCVTDVMSVLVATNDFMKILIPAFAGIITAAGKPTLALCFQSTCFVSAQTIASFFRTSLPPICAVYSSLSVCGSVSSVLNTTKAAQLLKKTYVFILSFCAALFSALLSAKTVLSVSADTVAVKGVKFLVGNAVPVVGGALSEALNSVLGGLSLLKSTVGVAAIIILVLINLPTLAEMLMWSISLKILSVVASLFGQDKENGLFEALDGLFSLMSAVIIYQLFLYVIAISLIITIAGMR